MIARSVIDWFMGARSVKEFSTPSRWKYVSLQPTKSNGKSVPAMFREQVSKLRSRPMVYSKRDRHWRPLTWLQMGERVDAAAGALCSIGLEPGERVAIIGRSSVEWVVADLACLTAGLVDVAIPEMAADEDIVWILRDSGARAAFIGEQSALDVIKRSRAELPDLEFIFCFHDAVHKLDDYPIQAWGLLRFESIGRDVDQSVIDDRLNAIQPSDLMTLIYTSGTTGQPKGVMISHENMISNCEACSRAVPITSDDVLLSFLPLSHSFERMAGYYMPALFGGATIYYAQNRDRLLSDLVEVQPTLMTGVPRIYEKVYSRVRLLRAQTTPVRRVLMDAAMSVGSRMSRVEEKGRAPGRLLAMQYRWVRDQVFGVIRERLGGRVRLFVSGGAPLAPEIAEFFYSSGVLILEGYGLTETSPVVSVNRPEAFRFGSVGRPLDNVRVRIAGDGEILVKAPSVMMGYWNQPEATREVVDDDGWLSTGDIGLLDRDGFLRITDRKKDLFKDSGGRYIAPQRIEGRLRMDPYIKEACLIGDGRPHCVALLVADIEAIAEWAQSRGLPKMTGDTLIRSEPVMALLEKIVQKVNKGLARHEQIRAHYLCDEEFSSDPILITPSLKIRRRRIEDRYRSVIDRLYTR